MDDLPIGKAFTLMEPGPVVLVTTNDGRKNNVMTISWTMVLDFAAKFAIATGPWNYSYAALVKTRECVISIPSADMLDTVVAAGTSSGENIDKFKAFGLTPVAASRVRAPLIGQCLANIECLVIDIVERHNILVLQGVAAHIDATLKERRRIHAVGDGSFVVDGRRFDRKDAMRSKLPGAVSDL